MANLLVAGNSTNGGTAITTDTSGTLEIKTGTGSGTTAISIDASQNVTIAGTLSASGGVTGSITRGTAVTASGTSVDFTGIPSTAKRITIMCSAISLNSTSSFLVQLGDSGGVETTGYDAVLIVGSQSSANTVNASTSGFPFYSGTATFSLSGSVILTNITGNTWVAQGIFGNTTTTAYVTSCAGTKALSATLDRVRVTTVNGTDTFDAGTINIFYE